jgi:hypothetical protein
MKIEDLKSQLEEKNRLKIQTEVIHAQLIGQIVLLQELIKKEEDNKEILDTKE